MEIRSLLFDISEIRFHPTVKIMKNDQVGHNDIFMPNFKHTDLQIIYQLKVYSLIPEIKCWACVTKVAPNTAPGPTHSSAINSV